MRLSRRAAVLAAASFLLVPPARAAAQATPDEAKALAEKAAAHVKEVGIDKAIADFNNPTGGYIDRELFVVVYRTDGKIICTPGLPAFLNRDATAMKDVDGKAFGQEIIAAGRNGRSGWVEYRMANPLTHKLARKRSYVIGVGDDVVFVGAFVG
jgi:cytochrome c